MHRHFERGFNLPEILIALVLGLGLLAAFVTVLQRCRNQFATNESLARLQDSARHALSVLVTDIEHAGFYGFNHAPRARLVRAGSVLAEAEDMKQPDVSSPTPALANLPSGAHDCGVNFAVDLGVAVQASNNTFALGIDPRDCAPTASAGGARAGSDTITIRHASIKTAAPRTGRLQLYSRRLQAFGSQDLFADGHAPGVLNADNDIRDVEVHTYYISNNSVERPDWPALRVKSLTESGGSAQFRDEEILPGVEDLQVELGVLDAGGATVSYAPADTSLRERIVAVRLWLRVRAEATEAGFVDARELRYSDVTFAPAPLDARHRRMLIERTVALRNLSP